MRSNRASIEADGRDIDFASIGKRRIAFNGRSGTGGFAFKRGAFSPCNGVSLSASELNVVIHGRKPFRMEWRGPDSDRLRSREVAPGHVHVAGGQSGFWFRSEAAPSFFAFSIDRSFVRRLWREALRGGSDCEIASAINVADPVISRFGHLAHRELLEGGAGGRLYAESLVTALCIHLLRRYGNAARASRLNKGSLTANRLRRVLDYIRAHLCGELSLAELADISGLSTHHFATAFKTATGSSPHRYVIEQRISRARDLLRDRERPISEVAQAVGFSSHSHLTTNFRRVVGVTPKKFRDSID